MKKIMILVLALLCISACSNAERDLPTPTPTSIPTAMPEQVVSIDLPAAEPDHYLYHIQDDDGNGMYLLGSIHVGQKPTEVDGKLLDAYNESETIAFEMADHTMTDSIIALSEKMNTINPISEIADAEFLEKFEWLDDEYEYINEEALEYNSFYIQQLASMEVIDELSLNGEYGVDMTLLNKAIIDEKEIIEIEGVQLQLEYSVSIAEQCPNMTMDTAFISKDEAKDGLIKLDESYANGTLENFVLAPEALWQTDRDMEVPSELYDTKEEMQEYEIYRDLMMFERQDAMYLKAIDYVKNDDTLLVVGALHLYGKDGLLSLFEENGYTVTKQ